MNFMSLASKLSEGASYVQARAQEAAAYARPDDDEQEEEAGGADEVEQDGSSSPHKEDKEEAEARVDPMKEAMQKEIKAAQDRLEKQPPAEKQLSPDGWG